MPHRAAAPKVAVIVPVYNPGSYLDRCVTSVLAQTMPPGDLEVIFVDDGSTDGSEATLDAVASANTHVRVIHEPNSGWAGRPRNVGIDAATAEYVLFVDHDDRLGTQTAARLHDRAIRDSADVVVGRNIGHGLPNGSDRAWPSIGPVTFEQAPDLVRHLKPHKLVRRQFLVDTEIRFPEGKRRLEDHAFVLQAFFQAKAISVVGDYACYHHYRRADRGNASSQVVEPRDYYRYVRESLAIIERHTVAGPFRNELLARYVRVEMLRRLVGPGFVRRSEAVRAALVEEVGSILDERVPLEVDAALPPATRVVASLARERRLDGLLKLAHADARVQTRAVATTAALPDGLELRVGVSGVGGGIGLVPDVGGGWALTLPNEIRDVVDPAAVRTTQPIGELVDVTAVDVANVSTSLDSTVTLRSGGDGTDWHLDVVARLPIASATPRRRGKAVVMTFTVRLKMLPQRRGAVVTIAKRDRPMPWRAYADGGSRPGSGQAYRLTIRRRSNGRLVLHVARDGWTARLRGLAASLTRRRPER